MPFPQKLLNQDETVILDFRPHWWFFAGPIFTGVILPALGFYAFQVEGDAGDVTGIAWGASTAAWAVWLLVRFLKWVTTEFTVTTDRIIFRAGVLRRYGREIPHERVNDISFEKSLWERMIGSGDLLIESAGELGQQRFSDIPHPDLVQQEIYKQIEDNTRRTAAYAAPPAAQASIPEQIAQLADLRDRGAITPEEFESKKQALLEKM